MNRALFATQLNTAWEIIGLLHLDQNRVYYPEYGSFPPSSFRNLTYLQIWQRCLIEQAYDFHLIDNSLVQFRVDSFNPLKVSYAYFECPYDCLTYQDYVMSEFGCSINDVGDEFMREYENYLVDCQEKDMVTPLRYDYDTEAYRQGRHPASHVHFGHGSNIRVGTERFLRPLSFLLLIIRQYYPNLWSTLLTAKKAPVWLRNVRDSLDEVSDDFWGPNDQFEMTLQ